MTNEANKQLVLRAMDLAFNQRDPQAAGELYAEDYVGVGPNFEQAGRSGAVAGLRLFVDAFTDTSMTFENVLAEDDRVVVHFTGTGRHTGEFEGKAPTGAQVSVKGVMTARVREDLIVQVWFTLHWG